MTTAIVTGGASGLGRATALRLAGRGMGVVVADVRNEEPFEHDNIRYAETDVRNDIHVFFCTIAVHVQWYVYLPSAQTGRLLALRRELMLRVSEKGVPMPV